MEVHSRSKGCLIQIRRHIKLVQDVERLIVEHVIWSQGRVLNVARLDTSSRIVQICELNKLPIQMGANKDLRFRVEFLL